MAVCRAAAARDRSGNRTGVSGAGLQLRINYKRPRLVLKWIAEIGENAVTHILGDEAGIALDQFRAAAVIGDNDAPQVLGV